MINWYTDERVHCTDRQTDRQTDTQPSASTGLIQHSTPTTPPPSCELYLIKVFSSTVSDPCS